MANCSIKNPKSLASDSEIFVHLSAIIINSEEMISVKVSYTVKPNFVAQNKQNINLFLADFKRLSTANFLYNVYIQEDGLTFLHVSMYENEATQQQILNVPSFLQFQKERDESGLEGSHQIETLQFVGSSLSLI